MGVVVSAESSRTANGWQWTTITHAALVLDLVGSVFAAYFALAATKNSGGLKLDKSI